MPQSTIFSKLIKGVRSIALGMREKQPVKVDEYVLEHMLLYHGLVGSSPDNQRDFRDVRADIHEAIREKSSAQLAIFLKLAPLWWEDKLQTIFEELDANQRDQAIELLMPDDQGGMLSVDSNPIKHSDWRVRSNTAKLLAFLKTDGAVSALGDLLADTLGEAKLSHSHIAYALGKFDSDESVLALSRFAKADEAWLRVDVAGALATSKFERVAKILAGMLASETEMKDYMSVAIAKHCSPARFLEHKDSEIKNAGLELVVGIVDASENSFAKTLVMDYGLDRYLGELTEKALEEQSARAIYCALALQNWAIDCREEVPAPDLAWLSAYQAFTNLPALEALIELREKLKSDRTRQFVLESLKGLSADSSGALADGRAELRYSIRLVGALKIEEAFQQLVPLLNKDSLLRDDLIQALGRIGNTMAAPTLIALAKSLVDVEVRNSTPKSKQPVLEEDLNTSRSYWSVLKALGNLPCRESAEFLLLCVDDFAPDKRSQALASLVSIINQQVAMPADQEIDQVILTGLKDNAPMMKIAALNGTASLNRIGLVNDVVKLIDINENAVSKFAFGCLSNLAREGGKVPVSEALENKLKTEKESFKRKRIQEFIANTLNG